MERNKQLSLALKVVFVKISILLGMISQLIEKSNSPRKLIAKFISG